MFRPALLAQGGATGFAFYITLSQMQLTIDNIEFWLIMVTAVALAAFSWVVSAQGLLKSESDAATSSAEAASDRKILHAVQDFMEKTVPASTIPPHLRNLANVKNAEMRQMVGEMSERLRAYEPNINTQPHWDAIPNYDTITEGERALALQAHSTRIMQEYKAEQNRFNTSLRPDALALWEELRRRVPTNLEPQDLPNAIVYGMFSGPRPMLESADALDSLARQLEE